MKSSRVLALLTVLILFALACNLPLGGPPTAGIPAGETPPAVTVTPFLELTVAAVTPVPPLTAEMLRNGTYALPESKETVTLTGGVYDRAESMENILHVAIVDPIAFGDLNGDGAEDAALLLSENTGGTGFFVSLIAILNRNGLPVQSASRFIEDRPQINGLVILGGRITLDAVIHGVNDPMCCPNFPVREAFRLAPDRLILTRVTSRTPGGDERAITITGPADGSTVTGSVQVSGSVTIAPFENTLACKIFDLAGNELRAEPLYVDAAEMGGAGTFNAPVSLAGIPAGTAVRLEISDLSAADGSILAMDSVELKVE